MHTQQMDEDVEPWYKQFWPWYIIALPGTVVIASIITITIAVTHRDSLVVDNYYKAGLAINQTLDKQEHATALGLQAQAQFDPVSAKFALTLDNQELASVSSLKMTMVHATLAKRDRVIYLTRQDDHTFVASMEQPDSGRWRLILEPTDQQWQLNAEVYFPATTWDFKPNA